MSSTSADRQSRRELLDTIDRQNEKITKYETRLRDVVRAYKGLTREKEALENSLKILSSAPKTFSGAESDQTSSEDQDGDEDNKAPVAIEGSKDQIVTLTNSLATLTAEKSRLEHNFQEDRKKLRNDLQEKEKANEMLKTDLKTIKEKSKIEIEELKSKLIIERHNREKETNDHALMLRELQKLVADERSAKEKLENELQTVKDNLKAVELAGTYNAEYEKRVRDLETQLKSKNSIINDLKVKANQTPPELLRLKDELGEMKHAHQRDLERAERKAVMNEERSASLRGQQETRVANLESRLQELSETVGSYDRLRQQDQNAMQKLRERITQLDLENQSLQKTHKNPSYQENLDGDNDSNLDVQSLIERILRLRTMLRDANRRSENPVDLDELLDTNEGEKKWKKAYYQLKDDFEKLKISRRTPSPFMSSPSKKSAHESEDEVDEIMKLKAHVHELNEKLKYNLHQLTIANEKDEELKAKEMEFNRMLADMKDQHKNEMDAKDSEFKKKVIQLEAELHKQRDRCLNMIQEKEDELAVMKSKLDTSPSDYMEDLTKAEETKVETLVLHYNEELAKNQQELKDLRSKKMELESALHELQMSALSKEQKYQDELEEMTEAMIRLKRMATKEGANLEYLKNVTLTYMLSTDAGSKEHMLKAIGAVLMFTSAEVKKVRDYNTSWWPTDASKSRGGAGRKL